MLLNHHRRCSITRFQRCSITIDVVQLPDSDVAQSRLLYLEAEVLEADFDIAQSPDFNVVSQSFNFD